MSQRLTGIGILLIAGVGCAASQGKPTEPVGVPHPPRTLDEALDRLQQTLPPALLQKMRDGSEQDMVVYHFSIGLRMRNTWGLWSGGPLYEHFAGLGLQHPDDMSSLILTSLWRRLHDQPLRVDEEVARYQEYWRVARRPDPRSNSACSGPIDAVISWGLEAGEPELRGVHMGKCCADGEVWSYHVDRGWYSPTASELAEWNEYLQWNDDAGRYDPCQDGSHASLPLTTLWANGRCCRPDSALPPTGDALREYPALRNVSLSKVIWSPSTYPF